jgi:hydroxypyruvate isomerase
MSGFSACIEWLFAAEAPSVPDRIRLAKAAGLDAVEFWHHSNKDISAVRAALDETGLPLAGILCELGNAMSEPQPGTGLPDLPRTGKRTASLTDRAQHEAFLHSVRVSLAAAQALGTKVMIAQSGDFLRDVPRAEQHRAIVDILREAGRVLAGSGVVIALEPLNDRIDHKGYYLTSTIEGLDIVDEVGSDAVRLLYDIYHAGVMEEPITLLDGRVDRIVHAHLADTGGRHEPGTGTLDYAARIGWLREHGYNGFIGLEYRPTVGTVESLRALRAAL